LSPATRHFSWGLPRVALVAIATLMLAAGCNEGGDEADEAKKGRKSFFNDAAYQGFFAHYPFGGHPPPVWQERFNALAPGGAEANPAAYKLARDRADRVGLVVNGEGQAHEVKIKNDLLKNLIDRVDKERN